MTIPACRYAVLSCIAISAAEVACAVEFVRDVRPILSAKCYTCHGPDEPAREADLRLDAEESAVEDRGGYAAIIPGSPEGSEVVVRIEEEDDDLRMPPLDSGKTLSDEEIAILREWIEEGAEYQPHWAFEEIVRPEIPTAVSGDDSTHPIDRFVRSQLDGVEVSPAQPTDPYTLVRRIYLDLIGLPPTPEEADEFAADPSPAAYEHLVDRLLDSPHYGERWARPWLDLARYSDTKGYEKDQPRTMWPYRDWVIKAINADMPFDRFTIDQLAGDMLPEPSRDQLIATGFHRNTMTNEEGGIDPQEFRYLSIVDRVATTGATWMGLTMGCAQCHTHKYDPITHQDFFAFFALFNNADEVELALPSEEREEELARIAEMIQAEQAKLHERLLSKLAASEDNAQQTYDELLQAWIEDRRSDTPCWRAVRPESVETNLPMYEVLEDASVLISGDVTNADLYEIILNPEDRVVTALRLEALPHSSLPNGGSGRRVIGEQNGFNRGSFLLTEFIVEVIREGEPRPVTLASASASFAAEKNEAEQTIDGRLDTGWSVVGRHLQRQTLVLRPEEPIRLAEGEHLRVTLRHDSFYPAGLGRFRLAVTADDPEAIAHGLTDETIDALLTDSSERSTKQQELLQRSFLQSTPLLEAEQAKLVELRNKHLDQTAALVLRERQSNERVTKRRHRGEYLKEREEVLPATPSFLPPLPKGASSDRLAMARWLVSRENPLTSRVVVNRHWQAFFGRGIVKTTADFGMQGEYPTHPELLDWLAAEFMEDGWSRKRLHRLIVTSDTYKQSAFNPDSREADPENKLLARMTRTRLDAELVRDVILGASGLLSEKIGGPSVFPPQPPGITEAAYGPLQWVVSEGEDRYRRGLYTFNKRTAPYAAFGLFDAPSGEVCVPRRNRSNTPLQALALLNDEVVNEAARELASESLDTPGDEETIAESMLRNAITRPVESSEVRSIVEFVRAQRFRLDSGELDAQRVLNSGPKTKWSFAEGEAGWAAKNDSEIRTENGELVVASSGEDPFISVELGGAPGAYTFRFTAESEPAAAYEVYWTTLDQPAESPDRRVAIESKGDGGHEYRARFSTDSPLRSLRLDTGAGPGETRIMKASLAYGDEEFDFASVDDPNRLAAWQLAARAVLNLDEVVTKP